MLTLVDTTLRDGEQSPGVAFTVLEKIDVARALVSIGISEIEAGTPVMGGSEAEAVKEIISLRLPAQIFTWNRVMERDIEASLLCGAKALYVSCPVSDIQITNKLRKTRKWVEERFSSLLPILKKEGLYVACGLEDASRADISFLMEICSLLERLGADRIRLCDTVGILTPFRAFELIDRIKGVIKTSLEIHTHNDFGLATANAIAGVKGGADYVSVTVNGLGERAGNASLEETVMALERLEDIKTSVDATRLKEVSLLVSVLSGRPVGYGKAIVGDYIFAHESGIHVDGVIKAPACYEPFPPEMVGAERHYIIGKHSGISSIIYKFKSLGITINREEAAIMLPLIRRMAEEKMPLTDSELPDLYIPTLAGQRGLFY